MKAESKRRLVMKLPPSDMDDQNKMDWLWDRFGNAIAIELFSNIMFNILEHDKKEQIIDIEWQFTITAESFVNRKALEEQIIKDNIIKDCCT